MRASNGSDVADEQTSSRAAIVDGWTINLSELKSAVSTIVDSARRGEGFTCLTLNLDHLVKLRNEARFRRAYSSARFVTADGAPVAALARRQWSAVRRTTGADMLIPLSLAAAEHNIPIYLFGTSDSVLEGAAAELKKRSDGKLIIAGMESPPQGFDVEGAEADAVIERIRQSDAGLCFVLLGAPKQEIFSMRAIEAGVECGFICAGAAADFIVGHQRRAPAAMQVMGLEWLWRLASNPHRLGMRYARCAVVFALVAGAEVSRAISRKTAEWRPG
ncbi:MAG: WecB/TagA/CpsF family glycosyltransferase [Hyphomicrobiaceae bacterium]